MPTRHPLLRPVRPRTALLCFAAAAVSVALGIGMAAHHYPDGFDWAYTVISRLASNRRNPDGAPWLAGFFLLAVALAWFTVGHIRHAMARTGGPPRVPTLGLWACLAAGAVLGLEGLLAIDLSPLGRKAHEAVAIVAFAGAYVGVVGLQLHRVWRLGGSIVPALLVVLPLLAVGVTQMLLFFDQRDLGWVNTEWREMGIPVYLSFAFWQWVAVGFLALGYAHVLLSVSMEVSSSRDLDLGPG
jgi:hypothetical protein